MKEKEPSAGGDTGTRGQGPPLLDPDSQDRIQDWIQQSSNQYSHRQAGDGQSKISSTKGKKVTVAEVIRTLNSKWVIFDDVEWQIEAFVFVACR